MDIKNILKTLRKLTRKLSPPLPVGGLQVTDFAVRYIQIKGDKILRASMKLKPGVVEEGKLINIQAFSLVMSELHRRVSSNPRRIVSVVLALPIRDVYIQPFSVPRVASTEFEEAADLNAKMTSPIDVSNSYYGWQRIMGDDDVRDDVKVLGAFVSKDVADGFINALENTGFGIAAVEFSSMSIVRNIAQSSVIEPGKPYIAVDVTSEGMNFIAVRKGVPHFHYLHSWREIQQEGRTISFEDFKSSLDSELNKVINFFVTHWAGEAIKDIIIITPTFSEEIRGLLEAKFKKLNTKILQPAELSVAMGAAMRGNMPRSEDVEISLASLSALGVFERQQVINFVRIWRNVFITAFGFLLAVFVVANIFVRQEANKIAMETGSVLEDPNTGEFEVLEARAEEFNNLVGLVSTFRSQGHTFSPLLIKMDELSGDDINITRLAFTSIDSPVRINGDAVSQDAAVAFKNRIVEQSQFENVDLPLSNLSDGGNVVSFTLTFNIVSLEFGE